MARLVADAALVGALLFAAAGTVAWPRAWLLLAVLLLVRAAGVLAVYRVSPALLRERAGLPVHADQPRADRLLLLAVLATGFLGCQRSPGSTCSGGACCRLRRPGSPVSAWLLFALGWGLKGLALRANAFAVPAVRLQRERAHAVVDSGVYAVVRHPFYAADPLIFVGLGLWLGSFIAALAAAVPVALVVARLRLEEGFLRRELPGYAEYAARVPHRLVRASGSAVRPWRPLRRRAMLRRAGPRGPAPDAA
jgi:protein-S-isoprenylcysteine O-methyltransferase Ste14